MAKATVEIKIDTSRFDAALKSYTEQSLKRSLSKSNDLLLANRARYAPFVETGTLRPSFRRRPITRPCKHPGTVFRSPKFRAAWTEWERGLHQINCQARDVLALIELQDKRHLWPRWAALLTLVIVGVAVVCR